MQMNSVHFFDDQKYNFYRTYVFFYITSAAVLLHPQMIELHGLIAPLNGLNWLPGFLGYFAFLAIHMTEKKVVDNTLRWLIQIGGLAGVASLPFLPRHDVWNIPHILAVLSIVAQMLVVVYLSIWITQISHIAQYSKVLGWKLMSGVFLACDVVITLEEIRLIMFQNGYEWNAGVWLCSMQGIAIVMRAILALGMVIALLDLIMCYVAWTANQE